MTYEMLKRLKESGFPLQRVSFEVGQEVSLARPAVVFSGSTSVAEAGIYYVPSLSDLVEACGNHLQAMSRVPDGWECSRQPHGRREAAGGPASTRGATLIDALAELWLTGRRR